MPKFTERVRELLKLLKSKDYEILELKEKLKLADVQIKELEEIETDLNSTLSYAQMGVDMWKTRAEELEKELNNAN